MWEGWGQGWRCTGLYKHLSVCQTVTVLQSTTEVAQWDRVPVARPGRWRGVQVFRCALEGPQVS